MLEKSTSYMLAVAAAIYSILAYTIAFSLEIWFIFNNDNSEDLFNDKNHNHQETQFIIPITALIQASIYFVLVILSLFLVLGVIIKSIVCLLCWIVAICLAFLPEFGLVLYTCLNVWKIETRNGQIELCFFVFRFIMNTFFTIFVCNLIKQWKSEKLVSDYMNSSAFSNYPYITTTSLRPNKNPVLNFDTYTKYNPNHFGTISLSDLAKINNSSLKGLSSLNNLHVQNLAASPCYTQFDFYNLARADYSFPSEFDTDSYKKYKMIRKPNDLDDKDEIKNQYFDEIKRNSPIFNDIHSSNYEHQIGTSLNDNVVLRQLQTKPFDYLKRPGSVANLKISHFDGDENFNNIINEDKDTLKKKNEKDKNSLKDVAL